MDTKISIEVLNRLRTQGRIAEVRRARKEHKCLECGMPIKVGESHISIFIAGGGLASLKFPSRIHIGCLNKYMGDN